MSPRERVEQFRDLAKGIVETYEYNQTMIADLESAVSDITHEIEFSKYDVRRGFDAYRRMHEITTDRRKKKYENEVLKDLYALIKSDPNYIDKLNRIVGDARKREEMQAGRKYYNRSTGTILGENPTLVSMKAMRLRDTKQFTVR